MNLFNGVSRLFSLAVVAILVLGCGDSSSDVKSVLNKDKQILGKQKNLYLVGVDANYPPLEFRGADGQLIGLEIDMLSEIAKEQKFEVNFLPMRWADIMPSLDSGARDIGMSLWYSDERAEKYDLSDPLYSTRLVLARLKKGRGKNKVDDISDAKISLQGPNTLTHTAYNNVNLGDKSKNNKLVMTSATYLAFKSLLNGESDYVLDSEVQLRYFIKKSQFSMNDFVFIGDKRFPSATWVYAVKKGNSSLINRINKGIKNLKDTGTFQLIVNKWYE